MLRGGEPEQRIDDGVLADAPPACVALVPVIASAQWSQTSGLQPSQPNSIFVTHLIATAERVPQTRGLRRATPAPAPTAPPADQHQGLGAAIRTRQTTSISPTAPPASGASRV